MNYHIGENHPENLSSSQRLLIALQQAKTQLEAVEYQKHEPIAIIGIGCRFPGGANNPEAYWHLLQTGVDAIAPIPKDRWDINSFYDPNPDTPGKMYTKYGGFLEQVDEFDPKFFNISPREAIAIDPQQRLLLEVSWEAMENAGLAKEQLQGSKTGIFIGIGSEDYSRLTINSDDFTRIDPHSSLGNARSIAAGRLAYIFGFQGPCLQLDTSCSSSLMAVHLACQSLRAQESNLALAGGVNLILSPETSIGLCKLKALSSDGHCKTFDAAADGYARGEGCGIVVLKRLSDAIADRDNILAIIRGSAANHDGRSNGMTAPNGAAQEALIRQALANAKVEANAVQYVEAHGTGTPLGDPIEVFALEKALCQGRAKDRPLMIGSVKTNIGHLEAAAGIASLLKVVLSLQHQRIPPHLHFHKPNPYIPWDRLPIVVPRELTPWSTPGRIAGVSAFGMSGTNVHLILEAAPEVEPVSQELERSLHLLSLTARSEKALSTLASLYQTYIQSHPQVTPGDFCFTANTGRSHFEYRLAVVAQSSDELAEKLGAFVTKIDATGLLSGLLNSKNRPKIAWLFTGQGSQYIGMGRQLYEQAPTFRQTIDRCHEILRSYLETPLLEVLYPTTNESPLINQTAYTQPALFSLEYALAELWQSWGIKPDIVMGHSLGEYVAACVAGVFSLEDGLKLIVQRSQLMQSLPPNGAMVAVFADVDVVTKTLAEYQEKIAIAAVNGVQNIVISGEAKAVESAVEQFKSQGIAVQQLQVSHPFHSPLMEPILAEFEQQARQVKFQAPGISLISNLTGQIFSPQEIPDANYWCYHLRQTVQFASGIDTLQKQGCDIFLEIGPRTTLIGMGKRCLGQDKHYWLPSLHPEQDDWQVLLNSLGKLAVLGVEINWIGFDRDYQRHRLALPTYPFERQRYWYEFEEQQRNGKFMNVKQSDTQLTQAEVANTTKTTSEEIILPKLRILVAELLHIQASEINIHEPFLEMGADSLVLMEAVRTIENAFGIKVAIRQFFEECTTIYALANYIEKNISPEWVLKNSPQPERESNASSGQSQPLLSTNIAANYSIESSLQPAISPSVVPSIPATVNNHHKSTIEVSATGLERIIAQQLEVMTRLHASQHELMRQQLEVLRNNPLSQKLTESNGNLQPNKEVETNNSQIVPQNTQSTPSYSTVTAPIPQRTNIEKTRVNGKLTLQQQQHLEILITRYNKRTQKSKQQTQSDRQYLADRRGIAGFRTDTKEMCYPIIGQQAQGSRIWDIDGNEYIDLAMGFGVYLFGHDAPFIKETLEKELQAGTRIGPRAELAGEVAQLICELTGVERAAFCNSGTEAVMTAIRLARTVTGRSKIAIFAGSYHGHFDGTLAVAQKVAGEPHSVPLAPGVPQHIADHVLVLNYGDFQSLETIKAHSQELAAVLVEPVQSRRPDLQPKEFLQQLRQLTAQTGIALIFDEVLVGFRIHLGGAQAWFGIEADLVTYGKIIGGGMPIGVVAGKAAYMNGIDGGMWNFGDASYPQAETTYFAGTFSKHPLTMATARAVLQQMKMLGTSVQEQLNQRTSQLATTLNTYFQQNNVPLKMVHFGSLFRFIFKENYSVFNQPLEVDLLFYHLLEKGVYIWEGRNCFISTAHTDEDIELVIKAFKTSVQELQAAGFFPASPEKLKNSSATKSGAEYSKIETNNKTLGKLTPSQTNQPMGFWERHQYKPSLAGNKLTEIKPSHNSKQTIEFSLFYFGQYDSEFVTDKYNLLFAGAKFADEHNFTAIWMPERHFHAFGGFSPNPSVISAALAKVTQRIQLRAGSVVLPIHHPIRVAEEWSVVDNLSQGRVGISFASGWHPNDFVFAPDAYGKHRELMFQEIATVQKLWRGEPIQFRDGAGKNINIQLFPMPVQPDVPIWITIVNNPETYIKAGEIGAGVLTNLMGQTVEDLAKNIKLYRESLERNGYDPQSGHVTVLLHTFVGDDINNIREQARQPFCEYLQSSIGLLQNLVKSQGLNINFENLTEDDKNYLLSVAYERYVQTSALIGTPDSCSKIIDNMIAIGVDEVACLIDFGINADSVLPGLSHLNLLRERYEGQNKSEPISPPTNEVPLTKAQKQLWLLAQIGQDESNAYNESVMIQLQGTLHLQAIRNACQKVVDRHEALRTVIDLSGEVQRVLPHLKIEVPLTDLSNIDASDRQTKIDEWLKQENQQSFDLTRGPLLRVNILKLESQLHLLIITAHHIIIDGWSMGLLLQEVGVFYSAECQGKVVEPEVPLQFKEYIHWQLLQNQNAEIAKQQAYWLEKLVNSVPILELPTDFPRSPVMTYRGARVSIKPNANLYTKLKEFSKKNGCTLFMTLLAGYMTLLHRLSNQDEIIVGIPVAGRGLAGSEKMIGYCAHLLPICSRLDGSPTFLDYLANIRHILLDAYENQDYTFAQLLEQLNLPRDPSRSPLVNVTFNLDRPQAVPTMTGLELSLVPYPKGYVQYDIDLNVIEFGNELLLEVDYSTDLFTAESIKRMLENLQTILKAVVNNPTQRLAQIPLISEAEKQQLLVEWNQTQTEYPKQLCIHQLISAQAQLTPEAVAVVFKDQHLSYSELNQRANQLAHHLQQLGVKAEVIVGLCLERSIEQLIAVVAIAKAGGAYLPLDQNYPQQRLQYLLDDAQIKLVLTQQSLLGALPISSQQVICWDTDSPQIAKQPVHDPDNLTAPENSAAIFYTSGSTGTPKGVVMSHQGLVNYALTALDTLGLKNSDRFLQLASISFDVFLEEILPIWLVGGAVVLPDEALAISATQLEQIIRNQQVTVMEMTTAHWHEWVSQLVALGMGPPTSLRLLLVGGETMLPEHLHTWQQFHLPLVHVYGLTETTITSTMYYLPPDTALESGYKLPIGRPLANTTVYLLDEMLQPVPVGAIGEVYIGGDGLARGYLHRQEQTAERFIPHPWTMIPGQRLYKTGDLGRYLADGNIEFIGRRDSMVKLRGFRIELAEVEAALSQHQRVQQVVVMLRADTPDNPRLVAYVVSAGDDKPSSQQLRQFLSEKLPEYMIPQAIALLNHLPLTPNGKVDRQALRECDLVEGKEDVSTALNPVEELLVGIWAEILDRQNIGIHDNFFELGGHSLLATRMVSRVRSIFNVELPLRSVFAAPTIAAIAQQIHSLRLQSQDLHIPPLLPIERNQPLQLSFAQARLWFLHQLEPQSPQYNMPGALRLLGTLDIAALEQSLNEIVRRHETLRTTFATFDGQPIQVIANDVRVTLPIIDLQTLRTNSQESEIQRLATQEAMQPFSLEQGPLLRITLVKLTSVEHLLLVTMHHIVSDGWSIAILMHEIALLYSAYVNGQPSPLPELPIQYADFAHWQRQWLQTEILQTQLNYWQQQLQGAPPVLTLPTDHPRPDIQSYRGGNQSFSFSATLTQQLISLSESCGVTLFMTLLAGFKTLLHWYTNQDDIVVGTDVANRNRAEIEGLIGFFVNQLILRTDLSGNPSFRSLLSRVRDVALAAYDHQDLPFDKLIEALNPERNLSYQPLFQVKFVLENKPITSLQLADLNISLQEIDNGTAKFDLLLNMVNTEQGLAGTLEYNKDLFEAVSINRMLEYFETLLSNLSTNIDADLNSLKHLLNEADKKYQTVQEEALKEVRLQKFKNMKRQAR